MSLVGRQIGSYRLERELRATGACTRYAARHVHLDRPVTLDLVASPMSEMILRRGRALVVALNKLPSPGIVPHHELDAVTDTGTAADGGLYVVSDPVEPALEDRLREGPLELEDARAIASELAATLAFGHAHGHMHGSLAPDVVRVAGSGGVALAGFWRHPVAWNADPSVDGLIDPRYLAPEQARSFQRECASDVYALGCTLFHAVCGRPPFEGTAMQVLAAHLSETPPAVRTLRPDVPEALAALIAAMLAKDPAARPTLAKVQAALAAAPAVQTYLPASPLERELLEAVRANPDDEAARMVYADWLEQHGHVRRATFLRREPVASPIELTALAGVADVAWRAAVSRPPVARCGIRFQNACTRRWDALTRTADDTVRYCDECRQSVYFCTSLDEARERGVRRQCIAIDASLAEPNALASWDVGTASQLCDCGAVIGPGELACPGCARWLGRTPMVMGTVAPPPPPPPYPLPPSPSLEPAKPSLLGRVRAWFRR